MDAGEGYVVGEDGEGVGEKELVHDGAGGEGVDRGMFDGEGGIFEKSGEIC